MIDYDAITDLDDLKAPLWSILHPYTRMTDEQRAEYKAYEAARKRLSNKRYKMKPLEWLLATVLLFTFIGGGLFIVGHLVAGGANVLTSPRPTIESY